MNSSTRLSLISNARVYKHLSAMDLDRENADADADTELNEPTQLNRISYPPTNARPEVSPNFRLFIPLLAFLEV